MRPVFAQSFAEPEIAASRQPVWRSPRLVQSATLGHPTGELTEAFALTVVRPTSLAASPEATAEAQRLQMVLARRPAVMPAPDSLTYADRFMVHQMDSRRNVKGAATAGASSGAVVGAVIGAVAGAGVGAIPGAALGGAVGGSVAALWANIKRLNGSHPTRLRLHVFQHMGIVDTRQESEQIMQQLMASGVLRKSHRRYLQDPSKLDDVLDGMTVNQRLLTETQRAGIECVLHMFEGETGRRGFLERQAAGLTSALRAQERAVARGQIAREDGGAVVQLLRDELEATRKELASLPSERVRAQQERLLTAPPTPPQTPC